MKCHAHRLTKAVARCQQCNKAICKRCTSFIGEEAWCKTCLMARQKKLAPQRRKQPASGTRPVRKKPPPPAPARTSAWSATGSSIGGSISKSRFALVLGFGFLLYQLYQSAQVDYEPIDPETMAEELQITPLQECLAVFYRIGDILRSGRLPPDSLRCDESGSANIVERNEGEVKISHPHPDFYGYSEIYVTSKNPQPTLVQ